MNAIKFEFLLSSTAGSVLLHDELHRRTGHTGELSINMDDVERQRYQQQLQLIDEQVQRHFVTIKGQGMGVGHKGTMITVD